MYVRRLVSLLGIALAAPACFSPDLADGEIECGTAGCPEGLFCAADGFCYRGPELGPDSLEVALAVGNEENVRVYAVCDGVLRSVWHAHEDTRQIAWGDVDDNGVPELAISNVAGRAVVYGYGASGFETRWTGDDQRPTRAVVLADVDDDGGDDLVLAVEGGPMRLYVGPELEFAEEIDGEFNIWELAAGDYDGDGDLDIAVAQKNGPDQVYQSNGGRLSLAWQTPVSEESETVAFADVNGDSMLDLATGATSARVRVYTGDGSGFARFWESDLTEDTEAVSWADYDGDGDADLAVANWNDPSARVYRNDGGSFGAAWAHEGGNASGAPQAESVAWSDYDGDGDSDLVVARYEAPNLLFRNDGGGQLIEVWRSPEVEASRTAVWAKWTRTGGAPALCSLVDPD